MHNDFTLFLRTYPNGQKVFHYLAYDEDGIRRGRGLPKPHPGLRLGTTATHC
jgi:hypothetical protein